MCPPCGPSSRLERWCRIRWQRTPRTTRRWLLLVKQCLWERCIMALRTETCCQRGRPPSHHASHATLAAKNHTHGDSCASLHLLWETRGRHPGWTGAMSPRDLQSLPPRLCLDHRPKVQGIQRVTGVCSCVVVPIRPPQQHLRDGTSHFVSWIRASCLDTTRNRHAHLPLGHREDPP